MLPHGPQVLSELLSSQEQSLLRRSSWTVLQSCELCAGHVLTAAGSEQVGELSML